MGDEFESHRLLEKFGQTLTVVAMRKELKAIDLDTDNCMSLLEYFVYHYKLSVDTLMSRPQGVNEDLEKAEAALEEVLAQIEASDPMPIRKALVSAQAALRKAKKSKNLDTMGKLWFIDREIAEAAKYKP